MTVCVGHHAREANPPRRVLSRCWLLAGLMGLVFPSRVRAHADSESEQPDHSDKEDAATSTPTRPLLQLRPAEPSWAPVLELRTPRINVSRNAGLSEAQRSLAWGSTLAGIGALSGMLSLWSAYEAQKLERATDSNESLLDPETGDLKLPGPPLRRDPAFLRQLSTGLAIGSGFLITSGGLLVFDGVLRQRATQTYIRPIFDPKRPALYITQRF